MSDHPVFHNPGFQPLVQETDQSTVVNPVPNKRSKPCVADRVKVALQIRLNHVAHLVLSCPLTETVQRRVRTAVGTEPVRAVQKVLVAFDKPVWPTSMALVRI